MILYRQHYPFFLSMENP